MMCFVMCQNKSSTKILSFYIVQVFLTLFVPKEIWQFGNNPGKLSIKNTGFSELISLHQNIVILIEGKTFF